MRDKRKQVNEHPLLPFKVGDRYGDGVIVNLDPTCTIGLILCVELDRDGDAGWVQDPRPAPVRAAYHALLKGVPQHRVARDLLLHQMSTADQGGEDEALLTWMLRKQPKGVDGCDMCPFSQTINEGRGDHCYSATTCEHPDAEGQDVDAYDAPPDWCPLRKAATTVFLEPGA